MGWWIFSPTSTTLWLCLFYVFFFRICFLLYINCGRIIANDDLTMGEKNDDKFHSFWEKIPARGCSKLVHLVLKKAALNSISKSTFFTRKKIRIASSKDTLEWHCQLENQVVIIITNTTSTSAPRIVATFSRPGPRRRPLFGLEVDELEVEKGRGPPESLLRAYDQKVSVLAIFLSSRRRRSRHLGGKNGCQIPK